MTLLAIDTSTAWGSLALHDGQKVLAEETWNLRRGHDAAVFAAADRLLELAGLTPASIEVVAVAVGPGSFTGVRIAIATAQGIARGSGASAVAVPTLDVIAHPWSTSGLRVCAVLPAGRGELCAALYRARAGRWARVSETLVGSAADLARSVRAGALFCGEIDADSRATLERELGTQARFTPAASIPRRAGHLAEIGWARFQAGEVTSPEALQPLYLRPPAIRGRAGELIAEVASPLRAGI